MNFDDLQPSQLVTVLLSVLVSAFAIATLGMGISVSTDLDLGSASPFLFGLAVGILSVLILLFIQTYFQKKRVDQLEELYKDYAKLKENYQPIVDVGSISFQDDILKVTLSNSGEGSGQNLSLDVYEENTEVLLATSKFQKITGRTEQEFKDTIETKERATFISEIDGETTEKVNQLIGEGSSKFTVNFVASFEDLLDEEYQKHIFSVEITDPEEVRTLNDVLRYGEMKFTQKEVEQNHTVISRDNSAKQKREKNVLVVDDEARLADLFASWMGNEFNTSTAYTGEEALDKVNHRTDVVVLDRRMPGISGDEVMARIREREIDCSVLVLSAVEPDFDIIEMEFDDYLVKPVSKDELIDSVTHLLTRSEYPPEIQEYYKLVTKSELLERKKDEESLESNERYQEMLERISHLKADIDHKIDSKFKSFKKQ